MTCAECNTVESGVNPDCSVLLFQRANVDAVEGRKLAADGLGVGFVWVEAREGREGFAVVGEVGEWFQVFEGSYTVFQFLWIELFLPQTLI